MVGEGKRGEYLSFYLQTTFRFPSLIGTYDSYMAKYYALSDKKKLEFTDLGGASTQGREGDPTGKTGLSIFPEVISGTMSNKQYYELHSSDEDDEYQYDRVFT